MEPDFRLGQLDLDIMNAAESYNIQFRGRIAELHGPPSPPPNDIKDIIVENVTLKGNMLKATFKTSLLGEYSPAEQNKSWAYSDEYNIDDTIMFQLKTCSTITHEFESMMFVSFKKMLDNDEIYSIKVSSTALRINSSYLTDGSEWRLIHINDRLRNCYDLQIEVEPFVINCFESLYDDTMLTDFEMRGMDGSIHVHRTVLAIVSPVLERMLQGNWKESKDRVIELPDITKRTLMHLKDYIYLKKLPDNDVESLLLLASRYMVRDLEPRCLKKLTMNLNPDNALDVARFARTHNMYKLFLNFLKHEKHAIMLNAIGQVENEESNLHSDKEEDNTTKLFLSE